MRATVATATEPEIAARKAALAELAELIGAVNDDRSGLYARRDSLVCELRDAGVSRAELAELTGTSVEMVKQILQKSSNGA